METTRVEPVSIIEGRAIGELQGAGRWQLSNDGAITTIRYDWRVETTKCWMNYLAPIARPIFKWNHNVVMRWGLKDWQNDWEFAWNKRRALPRILVKNKTPKPAS